jgi:hypothetical protein
MPFTFAHPAIVLPFNYGSKRFVSITGLIIGSLTPDFEYFLRMKVMSIYSHTLFGMFWYDLPLAVLLTFVFHNIVRNPLINYLPGCLAKRLFIYTDFNWIKRFSDHWLVVLASILIGIASHLLWDSFTHEHGFFTDHISFLRTLVYSIPLYKIFQHGSTIAGTIIIVWSLKQLPVQHLPVRQGNKFLFWGAIGLSTSLIVLMRLLADRDSRYIGHFVVSTIAAFLLSLIFVSLFYIKRKKASV